MRTIRYCRDLCVCSYQVCFLIRFFSSFNKIRELCSIHLWIRYMFQLFKHTNILWPLYNGIQRYYANLEYLLLNAKILSLLFGLICTLYARSMPQYTCMYVCMYVYGPSLFCTFSSDEKKSMIMYFMLINEVWRFINRIIFYVIS